MRRFSESDFKPIQSLSSQQSLTEIQAGQEALIAQFQALDRRELWIREKVRALEMREEHLALREVAQKEKEEKFQAEYSAIARELNIDIAQFDQRVAELYAREAALSACSFADENAAHKAVTLSGLCVPPVLHYEQSWFQQHDPIVEDWGPLTRTYDETLKKEVVTDESKIAYLNRVIDEMPDDTSDDERYVMFRKILDNRQSGGDPLLCLKLRIALAAGQYVLDGAESSDAAVSSVFFSFFKTTFKVVPRTEETERARILENTVLKSKDSDVIIMAVHVAETVDSSAGNFSNTYQQLLADCHRWVSEYESIRTPIPIAAESLIP